MCRFSHKSENHDDDDDDNSGDGGGGGDYYDDGAHSFPKENKLNKILRITFFTLKCF